MSITRLSDHEIEALLDRQVGGALEELETFIAALDRPTHPPADTFHMGTTLAAITRATAPRERPRSRRLAALGAMTAMFMATTGIAFAADASAPGDPLYRLDRAFESIGIGNGGLDERVAEYGVLVDRGEDDLAQHLVDEVVAESAGSASAFPASADNDDEVTVGDRSGTAEQERNGSAGSPADDLPGNPGRQEHDGAPGLVDNLDQANDWPGQNPGQTSQEPGPSQNQDQSTQENHDEGNQGQGQGNPDQGNQRQGQENQGPDENAGSQGQGQEDQGNQQPAEQGNHGQGQEKQGPDENQGTQGQGQNQNQNQNQDHGNQGQGQKNQGPGQNQGNQGQGQG